MKASFYVAFIEKIAAKKAVKEVLFRSAFSGI